ncbi:carbohydrate kinase [Rodentibacter caecimuris]|uniref:FGGY-family carbohydrate kinase n=2 Tax=Rodentibacter caecimuris TaxID=1796644 RepID=UPI000751449B|nr:MULTISPECIES: FGGY-family carbohydrate kinase [Pasteurellaceae]AOF53258.1 L-xylulose/3-keto-L-gulonate kinase [Pasteurellaceae bacterium NI1060]MCQ9123932.1 carbohydrate kinase [Rodentibacter heylii]MCR1838398.1 carbohydrate kinase [Pasteurella caecimuris]MCU0107691.1 carbohydrate kinase [Pasteurella caecimuris]MCX2962110.1 carbohydrate kinase [Rodentibacter heylii]
MDYYLGIDCGGTFIKAILVDSAGNILSSSRQNSPILSEKEGYAERDMTKLWLDCVKVIKTVIAKANISPKQVKSIGISAQGKGVFLLDKEKKPLGNAIISSDQRARDIVKNWEKQHIHHWLYQKTYQPLWAGHPVSILRWLKENNPDLYKNIGTVLMSHDYLRFCLTGKLHCEETNISESNLYNMTAKAYDTEIMEKLDIAEIYDKLPPIAKSNQVVGYVTPESAELSGLEIGTPVVGGLFDVVAATLCANLTNENELCAILGTWHIVSGITQNFANEQQRLVHGCYPETGKLIIHDDSPTSIANLEWFIEQCAPLTYEEINILVDSIKPQLNSVLFIPFLYGTNTENVKSGFYGIQSYHTKSHLLRAIYEGVIFSLMTHIENMKKKFPNTEKLHVMGGITKSQVWLQMLADITGITLEISEVDEPGCLGAALVAMQGVGLETKDIINKLTNVKLIESNIENYFIYQQKYKSYINLINVLKTL